MFFVYFLYIVVFVETLVKMHGVPEEVLEILLERGYFKTKAEAIRAGVLSLGEKYGIFSTPEELERNLVAMRIKEETAEIKAKGKKYLSEKEVKKKYGFK